jgi:DNA-binding transcriptional regulator PaaX
MARQGKLEKILAISLEILADIDDYFCNPRQTIRSFKANPKETEKTIWYLTSKKILNHNLQLTRQVETTLTLIKKPWDGKWRLVIFDIPEKERRIRSLIRSKLRELGLAPIQRSVWISPLPLDSFLTNIDDQLKNSFWFFIFQGRIRHEDPKKLVKELWPVQEWQEKAERLIRKLKRNPPRRRLKEQFWELILEHPRIPLDLLPVNWPLSRLVKAFSNNLRRSD